MQRILIFDTDGPLRTQLTAAVRRTHNTEVVVVADEEALVSQVKSGRCVAVFADGDLLSGRADRLVAAVRSSPVRPMLIIASNEKAEDLDPELVTLVVRKPYDVKTLTGILLSAVIQMPAAAAAKVDTTSAG